MRQLFQNLLRLALVLFIALSLAPAASAAPKKLLVVTVTMGFHHSSTVTAARILTELGEKTGDWTVVDVVKSGPRPADKEKEAEWTAQVTKELAEKMSVSALQTYDGVIFASTTGVLPLPDKQGFLDWVKSGHAFIGIHAASDTFHGEGDTVDPYIEMLGGEFKHHDAQVRVDCLNQDTSHPATKNLPKDWVVFDEIYQMKNFDKEKVHNLLALDKHPNPKDQSPGFYPVAWCKDYGKGKIFYTSLGHREDVWDDKQGGKRENTPEVSLQYQQHLIGGIRWALGLEK